MLHFLLILLAIIGIWKLLSRGPASGASLLTGLRRLALVLAIAGAALGGGIGYAVTRNCHTDMTAAQWVSACTGPDPGGIVLGVIAGFAVVWVAASIVIWILSGFLTR